MSSPACPSRDPTLDQTRSANMEQALAPPGLQECPQPSSSTADSPPPLNVHSRPLPVHIDPNDPPVSSPSSEMSHTCIPPAEMSTASQDPGGEVQPGVTEGGVGNDEVENSAMHATPDDLSPSQPMEQEVAESTETCPAAPRQPESVEMECPSVSHGERDRGDHQPGSDSTPSLAAALKELHQLLVCNNQAQAQSRSSSCSPSHPRGRDSDKSSESSTPPPEDTPPAPPTPSTAADAETSDAKASCAAASAEEPPQRLVPDLPAQEERLSVGTAESAEQGPPRCPDGSKETTQDDTNIRMAQPEPDVSPGSEEFREPHEEQPGGEDVDDAHASATNVRDHIQTFLSPLSVQVHSPSTSSSSSSAPLLAPAPLLPSPVTEPFPAEHVQRIQAAGFSAREAVEALEHAHGVVELALLALLARSITVPT